MERLPKEMYSKLELLNTAFSNTSFYLILTNTLLGKKWFYYPNTHKSQAYYLASNGLKTQANERRMKI